MRLWGYSLLSAANVIVEGRRYPSEHSRVSTATWSVIFPIMLHCKASHKRLIFLEAKKILLHPHTRRISTVIFVTKTVSRSFASRKTTTMTIKPANVRTQTQSRPWTIVLSIASEIDDKLPFDIGVREIEKYWKRQRNLSVLKGSEWWKGKFYLWSSSRCAPCIVWRVFRLNFVILFPLGGVLWQKKLNFLRPPSKQKNLVGSQVENLRPFERN